MMKKLLTLFCVLAVASVASAALLVLSVDGDTTVDTLYLAPSDYVTIDVYCADSNNNDQFWLGIEGSGDGEWTDMGTAYSPPGPEGVTVDDGGYGAAWRYFHITDPGVYQPAIGTWYEVEFHCTGPDDVVINLYDENGVNIEDSILVHQPEPMTIALLGIGGLFLRRRK